MTAGIRSPWAQREKPPEDPLAGARKGRQAVAFGGRAYTLLVTLPFRMDDETRARTLGEKALGECLVVLAARVPAFAATLAKQQLAHGDRPLGPCVEVPLPEASVWGVASSTNSALAYAMVIDRLCLALSEIEHGDPVGRDILKSHFVTIVRAA